MEIISTSQAPAAIGPYSQALRQGDMVYLSGQIPLCPESMEIKGSTVPEQTEQVFLNIKAVLKEAGGDLTHVVKTTVFMVDLGEFVPMNEVYESSFGGHKPARSTIQVAGLPKGSLVEIEVVACIPV